MPDKIPDTIREAKDKAVLQPADTAVGTLPFWDWEVAKDKIPYSPYIVIPMSYDEVTHVMKFKLVVARTLEEHPNPFELVLEDPEGDEVVADFPGTAMQWVRDLKADKPVKGKYCLLFLSPAIPRELGFPKNASVRLPDDKWPKSAGASPNVALREVIRKILRTQAVLPALSPEEIKILEIAAEVPSAVQELAEAPCE